MGWRLGPLWQKNKKQRETWHERISRWWENIYLYIWWRMKASTMTSIGHKCPAETSSALTLKPESAAAVMCIKRERELPIQQCLGLTSGTNRRIFVTLDHKTNLKSLRYICSNSQKYIVWVKIIYFYFMSKIIRILSKDHVPLIYFVNFLP